jgi:hypothetical protein
MRRFCLFLALLGLLAESSHAAIRFYDDFEDGRTDQESNPSDIGFYTRFSSTATGTTRLSTPIDLTLGTGQALLIANQASGSGPVVGVFREAISLTEIGSSLRLSFDFRLTTINDSFDGFQFGFGDSNGTAATGDNQSATDNDHSYFGSIATGAATPTSEIFKQPASANTRFGNSPRTNGFSTLGADNDVAINDLDKHSAEFWITRTSASTLELRLLVDGSILARREETEVISTTFDEVFFKRNINGSAVAIDNVTIDVVPEPASALLLSLGATLLGFRRIRSQHLSA